MSDTQHTDATCTYPNQTASSAGLIDPLTKLDACIHCGMCLSACPTYRVTGSEAESPRGRLYLMRAYETNQLDSSQQLSQHLDLCLGCMGCQTACPSGVDYHSALMHYRQVLAPTKALWPRRIQRALLKWLLPNAALLLVGREFLRWYQTSVFAKGFVWLAHHPTFKDWLHPLWQRYELLPTLSDHEPIEAQGQSFGNNERGRVGLFLGCIMNTMFSQVHRATIDVLVTNGYQVVIPTQQTCCGALAYHGGEVDITQSLIAQNIQAFLGESPVDIIAVNAAGCGSTLKHSHSIFPDDKNSQVFADKSQDVLALLAKHPLRLKDEPLNKVIAYHAACHLHHAQGIQQEPIQLLEQIPGVVLVPLVEADMCCGSAGVYNISHPDMSQTIAALKIPALKTLVDQGVTTLVSANPGCLMQLQWLCHQVHIPLDVCHPIEILAQATASPA